MVGVNKSVALFITISHTSYFYGNIEDIQGNFPVALNLCQSYKNFAITDIRSTARVKLTIFIVLIVIFTSLFVQTLPKDIVLI